MAYGKEEMERNEESNNEMKMAWRSNEKNVWRKIWRSNK